MAIQGKTALITGASRGIGRAIAVEFARQGAGRLLLVARDRHLLEELAAELQALGTEAIPLPMDLRQPVEVSIAIAHAWRDHGPIHYLVNCAGVAYQSTFLQSRLPQVQDEIGINLLGTYTVTRMIARRMVAQRQGTIINVSSLMGKLAAPTMATYSATKFALLGFTQALRGELAPHNVKVVALLPSLTDTDMVRHLRWFRWVTPVTPEDVAQALIRGLNWNSNEILVGWQSHVAVLGHRLAPQVVERFLQWAAPLPKTPPKAYSALR